MPTPSSGVKGAFVGDSSLIATLLAATTPTPFTQAQLAAAYAAFGVTYYPPNGIAADPNLGIKMMRPQETPDCLTVSGTATPCFRIVMMTDPYTKG